MRTENNFDQRRKNNNQHLPKGYYKKRKKIEYIQLQKITKMTRCNFFQNCYNCSDTLNIFKFLFLVLWIETPIVLGYRNFTTIEPDLMVLSMEKITAPVHQPFNGSGICGTVNVRFRIEDMEKYRGCRVIEGSASIILLDDSSENDFVNYSFPELTEITGFLMLYRVGGVKSLSHFFPNLAVIRGRDLFKDYSLIIYEVNDLEEIGLFNLQTIERGNVRIEKNDILCFADRIDWTLIAGPGEHYIAKNQLPAYCPVCPYEKEDLQCPRTTSNDPKAGTLCWNQKHCQMVCKCNGGVCNSKGKCCDPKCIGGCDNNNIKKCIACKRLAVEIDDEIRCQDNCPEGKFEYMERRCLTRQQCFSLNNFEKYAENVSPYIPFNGTCMRGCPPTYVDFKNQTDCKSCGSECQRRCQAKIIDSIAAAQSLKGCAIIDGPLEIRLRRSSSKSLETATNVVKELENSLSEIVEIQDYLKIARSYPIMSLSFLKNLKVIKGKRLESNKYSVVLWDNQNLQELWNQTVSVENGKLFFHFNPLLCFFKIEKVTENPSQIENYDMAKMSNGDKTTCNVMTLGVKVVETYSQAALLQWSPLKLGDERALLGYGVLYIPAPFNNVTIWGGRDACNDGWFIDDVNDFTTNDSISYPLTKLEPYTQYAFYVKAYTLATEKIGAQSDIHYFRTSPGQPQAVTKLKAVPKSSSSIILSWEPPRKVNGKLQSYIIRAKIIEKNDQILEQRDYCLQPFERSETIIKTDSKPPDRPKPSLIEFIGPCDCNICIQTCQKAEEDDEDRQSSVDFEDEIQNYVYVKTEPETVSEMREKRRARRQAEFPEDLDKEIARRRELETESTKTEDGKYRTFYQEINDTRQTTFELSDLRHYSNYQFFLKACREKDSDDRSDENCGPEAQISAITLKEEKNDVIPRFDVVAVPGNGSLGQIKATWEPPPNPNGLLLSYTIRYKKNDLEHTKWESSCISHKIYMNQSFHILKSLTNGNYSIQIAATSMAGMGNFTQVKYVIINEYGGFNIGFIAISLTVVLILLFLCLIYAFKRYYLTSISNMKLIAIVNSDYAGVDYKQDDWEVPREKVVMLQELGQGSFGMVYEGIIKDFKDNSLGLRNEHNETRCAIKTVNENATDKERISFLNEASVMKQFDTAFVVRLLGVVSQSQPTFVVMELMSNGDLKSYLRSHRAEYDNTNEPTPQPPTLRQILQMAAEIADGMSYLSAKKFVHRDLAARNCMVAEDLTVKIGDFGMTRDIYETDYYRKGTKGLLPVRWMSPESLKDGVFTSSSDVFSYGVVLWEMATLASQPYQGLSNDQVLRYVIEGGVMERPENCPDKLYELMRRCWQHRPTARPTFMKIIEMLLDDVNQNFRNISFYFTKEGQDTLHQQKQGELALNIHDDVTTPLRQDEADVSSLEGNFFFMEEIISDHKL